MTGLRLVKLPPDEDRLTNSTTVEKTSVDAYSLITRGLKLGYLSAEDCGKDVTKHTLYSLEVINGDGDVIRDYWVIGLGVSWLRDLTGMEWPK